MMSNIIYKISMQDELKINKREIIYSLGENGSEVELRVDGREGLFLVYFE